MSTDSAYLNLLKNRIALDQTPFTERNSRIMVFRKDGDSLWVGLAEYEVNAQEYPTIEAWHFTDGEGQPLACDFTTFPHRITCQTSSGTFTLAFVDGETLLVALPPGRCGLTLRTHAETARTDRRGGLLEKEREIPCNLVYTTNADLTQNDIIALDSERQEIRLAFDSPGGKAMLLNITRMPGFNRWVPDPEAIVAASARRWHEWFAAAPEVAARYRSQYYYAWWIMGVNLIYPRLHPKREGMVPSKIGYVGIWHWDAYFHALAYRHVDMQLAQDQLRIMFDFQLANGMIPDVVHDEGILALSEDTPPVAITKPPLAAWVAWKLYEVDNDQEFLDEIYDAVVRSQNWWFAERDIDNNGLCEYQHRYSSGLDDNPLWDQGPPVESPDLNAYLCLQYDYLSRIADVIGKGEDAARWAERAGQLAQRLIDLRWDDDAGLFWAVKDGERINVRTPFNLYPLITGRMPKPIAEKLVATLTDEQQFWSRYPVPTVALDDPKHDPMTMWRGPVWINPNYVLIGGLQRTGYADIAKELRRRTLEMVMRGNDICEYYHPETGEKPPRAANMFGWSAALFIDLAIASSAEA